MLGVSRWECLAAGFSTSSVVGFRLSPKVHTLAVHPREELLRGMEPLKGLASGFGRLGGVPLKGVLETSLLVSLFLFQDASQAICSARLSCHGIATCHRHTGKLP